MAYSMYCKLFASLYQGTLRGASHEILVFTNLLAHAGRDGVVDKHFRAIAEETGLTVAEVKEAVLVLESPDPESRSPDEGGARIIRMDEHRVWGWRIVNYGKYRAIRSEEDRAEQNRLAQERWRNKNKPASAVSKPDKPMQRERDKQKKESFALLANAEFVLEWEEFRKHRKLIKHPLTDRAAELMLARLQERPENAIAGLQCAMMNNWRGFQWDWFDNMNFVLKNGSSPCHQKPRNLSFEARAKRKGELQDSLNAGSRSAPKDRDGRSIYTDDDKKERDAMYKEMEEL